MDPVQYFTNYANKYDYDSKSDHGRVNGELSGAFYGKRLDVYNLPNDGDENVILNFLSGKSMTVHFVVTTTVNISSSAEAQSIYDAEIKTKSPYTNSTSAKKLAKQPRRKPIELFEHRQPLEKGTRKLLAEAEESDFELIFSSADFFYLYSYK